MRVSEPSALYVLVLALAAQLYKPNPVGAFAFSVPWGRQLLVARTRGINHYPRHLHQHQQRHLHTTVTGKGFGRLWSATEETSDRVSTDNTTIDTESRLGEADISLVAESTEDSSLENDDDELPYFDAYDFINSTWAVGVLWEGQWSVKRYRVFFREDGSCVWDDRIEGRWSINTRTNFFEFTRAWKWYQFSGRRYFQVSDYKLQHDYNYSYLDGMVSGWSFWKPLQVMGQWQAYREGLDDDEAGSPPWYKDKGGKDVVSG